MISQDIVGRITIRLCRALNHKWAKDLGRDEIWNWATAKRAIEGATSQRAPRVEGDAVVYDTFASSTQFRFSPREVRVTFFDRQQDSGPVGLVEAIVDADLGPAIIVESSSLAALSEASVWRYDRALTSVSCGPWIDLYRLTPIGVILHALPEYIPAEPSRLVYAGGRIASSYMELDAAMARAGRRFFTDWGRMATR